MLKLFLLSTVMTVTTMTLTGLPRSSSANELWETGHLGHVLLVLSWVGLFVLLCAKMVMWTCHLIKQIFHSSSKNRSDMALGGISLYILLAVVEYLLNIVK